MCNKNVQLDSALATFPSLCNIASNHAHAWFIELRGDIECAHELLSDDEKARAKDITMLSARHRYIAAHATLRQILGAYLKTEPRSVLFGYGPYGKPELLETPKCFNLSHSHNMALVGVTENYDIGVDIEYMLRQTAWKKVTERFFASDEQIALARQAVPLQRDYFFHLWTLKEAYTKARGEGLKLPLASFSINCETEQAVLTRHQDIKPRYLSEWSLHTLTGPKDYIAAIAVKGKVDKIQCYQSDLDTLMQFKPE